VARNVCLGTHFLHFLSIASTDSLLLVLCTQALFYSLSTIIVAFAFMIGAASAKYFEVSSCIEGTVVIVQACRDRGLCTSRLPFFALSGSAVHTCSVSKAQGSRYRNETVVSQALIFVAMSLTESALQLIPESHMALVTGSSSMLRRMKQVQMDPQDGLYAI
jgi:hypothetical protein